MKNFTATESGVTVEEAGNAGVTIELTFKELAEALTCVVDRAPEFKTLKYLDDADRVDLTRAADVLDAINDW